MGKSEKEKFSDIGKAEAISKLYDGSGFVPSAICSFESNGKAFTANASKLFLEGVDFDLTYFPLKHLGYKCIIAATGELYASLAHPRTLSVILGISSKLDFPQVKEIWSGILAAAKEHGYASLSLDLVPSLNGLCISISATGETSLLTQKRRQPAKSMDLICVSNNLGAAYFGQRILEREKKNFENNSDKSKQPELKGYKHLIGAYLKPEITPSSVSALEDAEIIPSHGYLVTHGLAEAIRRLVHDSGFGAKIYTEKIPFAGGTIDLGKELNIDPVDAALHGGDDFRLLYTIPIGSHDRFRHDFQTYDIIGHLAKPDVGAVIVTPDGAELNLK